MTIFIKGIKKTHVQPFVWLLIRSLYYDYYFINALSSYSLLFFSRIKNEKYSSNKVIDGQI